MITKFDTEIRFWCENTETTPKLLHGNRIRRQSEARAEWESVSIGWSSGPYAAARSCTLRVRVRWFNGGQQWRVVPCGRGTTLLFFLLLLRWISACIYTPRCKTPSLLYINNTIYYKNEQIIIKLYIRLLSSFELNSTQTKLAQTYNF